MARACSPKSAAEAVCSQGGQEASDGSWNEEDYESVLEEPGLSSDGTSDSTDKAGVCAEVREPASQCSGGVSLSWCTGPV